MKRQIAVLSLRLIQREQLAAQAPTTTTDWLLQYYSRLTQICTNYFLPALLSCDNVLSHPIYVICKSAMASDWHFSRYNWLQGSMVSDWHFSGYRVQCEPSDASHCTLQQMVHIPPTQHHCYVKHETMRLDKSTLITRWHCDGASLALEEAYQRLFTLSRTN